MKATDISKIRKGIRKIGPNKWKKIVKIKWPAIKLVDNLKDRVKILKKKLNISIENIKGIKTDGIFDGINLLIKDLLYKEIRVKPIIRIKDKINNSLKDKGEE